MLSASDVIPEVSVIIPAYNTEAYIAQAIESALAQTEKNIEVIVIDDASIDATVTVAKGFLDKRLNVLVNQQNLGASGARNRGIREAKGKWVALLDSDDWYAPERLEKLLKVAYAENADLIADDIFYIEDREKLPWTTLLAESGERIDEIIPIDPVYFVETDIQGRRGLHLGLTKPLIKRDFLFHNGIEYDENIKLGQDFYFSLSCLAHGGRFILVPEPYYFYRSHAGSLVTTGEIKRLDQACSASQYFLQQEIIQNNPKLLDALSKRLALLEKTRPYFRVIDPVKQRKPLGILIEMVRNPYFFVHLISQLPRIVSRRVHYYVSRINKEKIVNLNSEKVDN